MSAHTPGPWRVVQANVGTGAAYKPLWVEFGASKGTVRLADEPCGVDHANARLIAAAPELLEALVEASVALRIGHNSLIALEKASVAIAKATGEQA